jgi:Putative peptidoglycan binding domain/Glycosyl hydrolase family 46
MPARTLLGLGAIGEIVKQAQRTLSSQGFGPAKADGVFGDATSTAVRQFQTAKSLPVTGLVDETTWQPLTNRPVPPAGERSLQLTAAFEGHGFELAVGNFDGAYLTWGIIGFTMKSGAVQSIVSAVNQTSPDLIKQAFGAQTDELLQLMSAAPDFQKQWANDHTVKSRALAEPWRSMFATFGSFPQVQQEQLKHVRESYLNPATATAKKLRLTSELGLALCFDVHVQNGGIKPKPLQALIQQSKAGASEPELRKSIANAVADSARKTYKEDVRTRKMAIATGEGKVHGHVYALNNWGLSGDIAAQELSVNNTTLNSAA